jgi:ABC-type Na+ transport system ATPase subunit NatA
MARRAVLDFVKRYPSERRTVIYSTHVMSEVEELCRRVAILYQGKLVALDEVAALKARFGASTLEQAFFALVASQGVRA